jgi:hypothetical protein
MVLDRMIAESLTLMGLLEPMSPHGALMGPQGPEGLMAAMFTTILPSRFMLKSGI